MLEHREGPRHIHSWGYHRPGKTARRLLIAAGVGIAGVLLLQAISAATFAVGGEAESGVVTGNAIKQPDATASGGQTVAFGSVSSVPPAAPSGLVPITGGTSIAVRWKSSALPGVKIKRYDIIRDGTKIGSVTPGLHVDFPEKDGNGYLDLQVTPGTRYTYQVQAVSDTDALSPLSAAIAVTHPTSTTPTPSVSYVLNGNTDLEPLIRDAFIPLIKTWYPKAADSLIYPTVTPIRSIQLIVDGNDTTTMNVVGDTVYMSSAFIRNTVKSNIQPIYNAILHEMVHVVQSSGQPNKMGHWLVEGGADHYPKDIIGIYDIPIPYATQHFTDGYNPSAYLIQYIQSKYEPGFMRKWTISGLQGDYKHVTVDNAGGKSLDDIWAESTGFPIPNGAYRTAAKLNTCINADSNNGVRAAPVQISSCNGSNNQSISAITRADGRSKLMLLGLCLDLDNAAVSNGTLVHLQGCRSQDDRVSSAQTWIVRADGSIMNPASGRCLEVKGGNISLTSGQALGIWDCNGGAWQKWSLPTGTRTVRGVGPISFKTDASRCIDSPNGSSTGGTQLQIWTCNGNAAQQVTASTIDSGNVELRILNNCLDVKFDGTAEGTVAWLYGCNFKAAQKWQVQSNGSLKSVSNGKCLDTAGKAITTSALLVTNTCNGSPSQSFVLPGRF